MKLVTSAGLLGGTAVLLLAASAAAQDDTAAAEGSASVGIGTEAAAEGDAAGTTEVAQAEEAPMEEAAPMEEPAPMEEAAPMAEPAAEAPAAAENPLSFSIFADANYTFQSAQVGTFAPSYRAYAGAAPNPAGLMNDTGFDLSFAGIDATYEQDTYGATVSLRFGNSVKNYHFNSTGTFEGTTPLTQAYATWKPTDMLTLDFGMFGTIFGAEVAESWNNLNYSRGGLYFAMQPFWHTGIRANIAFSDAFALNVMVANDTNTFWNYDVPTANFPALSVQAVITPSDIFSVSIGGTIAEDGVASGQEMFGDIVASLSLDDLSVIFNGDIIHSRTADSAVGGISLAAGYQFTHMFGLAARIEALFDPNQSGFLSDPVGGATAENVITETFTIDLKPLPDSDNLIVRAEQRLEAAGSQILYDSDSAATDLWLAGILGVVVHTD